MSTTGIGVAINASEISVPESVNLSRTENCVYVTTHYSMGIGRMKQISAKVVSPDKAEASSAVNTNQSTGQAVVVTTAKASELRSQKRLLESEALDAIRTGDYYMQKAIEHKSAACDKSTRFMPQVNASALYQKMVDYQTVERPALVARFMREYRRLEAQDFAPLKDALGDQFSRSDYKASEEVEAGFIFTFNIRPVGQIQLSGLPDWIIAAEVQKEQDERAAAVLEWKQIMRETLAGLVDALFASVKKDDDGKRKKFYESHVENLLRFVDEYSKLDLANDLETQGHVTTIRQLLTNITPERLHESENLKRRVAAGLETIKPRLAELVEVQPSRRFRD